MTLTDTELFFLRIHQNGAAVLFQMALIPTGTYFGVGVDPPTTCASRRTDAHWLFI